MRDEKSKFQKMHKSSEKNILNLLYEFPSGNQVDGLPLALNYFYRYTFCTSHFAAKAAVASAVLLQLQMLSKSSNIFSDSHFIIFLKKNPPES